MTMTRNELTKHLTILGTGRDGYTAERFASPKLANAAIAERGHAYMTPAEYAARRMDRGQMPECRIDRAIERRATILRHQRVLGGRRVTGVITGTKREVWMYPAAEVTRCTRRR